MSIFDEMRSDLQRAGKTNTILTCVVFWCFVWVAWISIVVSLFQIFVASLVGCGVI